MIQHSFYANGKCVWTREWYKPLTDKNIKIECELIEKMGLGKVDTVTDNKGNMIRIESTEQPSETEAE